MSADSRDYKAAKRVILQTAAVYLPSYKKPDDMGNFAAAEKLLDKYNIGLSLWPAKGGRHSFNSLPLKRYEDPIPDTEEAYKRLRKDVNERIKNKVPRYPFVVPIIFCEFAARGAGITPHSTKLGAQAPACLIAMSNENIKDKMTILHEMGHSALYPVHHHDNRDEVKGNLMHEADGRHFLLRYQVEAFEHAFFARYA
ncbi:hypothetical protein DTL21_11385 [Bremerella cremea]|uniref:Uncharacterized protein n=1 Tax=Blastopirellula marina TaxID=124 RepID=A0A2S8FPN0_9BACT|nr:MULTISPECIES: hypothetical protein [Pirellulaceae]PQO34136.1 hypothetical protein C5Y83_11380 [Blastopirellula marina]RCS46633.1 hypothetical protein DTL21_11385 [Bremerella cremea]